MISEKTNSNSLRGLLEKSRHLAVCISENNPSLEDKIIALALAIGLKINKRHCLFSGHLEDDLLFPHKDEVESGQGNRDLVIELPLKEEEIEKISTAVNNQGLMEIIVQAQEEKTPIPSDEIKMSYRGLRVDLIILVGISRLEELGQLYLENNILFQKVPLVHFYKKEPPLGSYNIPLTPTSSLLSFIQWLKKEEIEFSTSGYDLLLWGLRYLSQNFSRPLTVEVAEAVSWLLKQGAVDRPLNNLRLATAQSEKNVYSPLNQGLKIFPGKRSIRVIKS